MNTLMLRPCLVAFFAGLLALAPTNIYKICAWNAGTSRVDPWRVRAAAVVRQVGQSLRAWLVALWSPRMAFACVAVLLAVLLAHLSASHDGGMLFAVAVPVVTLKAKRAELLEKAAKLKGEDGSFADDAARSAFDATMTEVEGVDEQIRQAEAQPAPTPATTAAADPTVEAARQEAVKAERARAAGIRSAVTLATRLGTLPEGFAEQLVERGVSMDEARVQIFDTLARTQTPIDPHIEVGEDAKDKAQRGMTAWLLQRSGLAAMVAKYEGVDPKTYAEPGEFRGLTLVDLARLTLTRAGRNVQGMSRLQIAGEAMAYRSNYQTTSDFATLLENVMHKILRAAYAIQPDTWSRWCGTGTVSDFRDHNWYRMGSLTALDDLNEHGEFKSKEIPDAEKSTYSVNTKGNVIAVSRQVIVNDDLGAVTRLTAMLGRAGKLTIEKAVYALLALNSGLGPTQSDSQPLYHANRNNVGTTGAIAMSTLDADAAVMAVQKDPNGQDILDLRPSVLLVARGLEGTARSINEAEYDPDTTGKLQKPNIVRGLFTDIVGTGRLTGTRRYLFADPSLAPVFLVSFLEGQQEPVLETKDGWRVDGVEMKARLDFGVDVVDFRGTVTNAG